MTNERTKPDSDGIERFVDGILDEITMERPMVYRDGEFSVDMGNSKEVRRVLKDGIYGFLWGKYSSKTRESVKDLKSTRDSLVKILKGQGMTDEQIAKLTSGK